MGPLGPLRALSGGLAVSTFPRGAQSSGRLGGGAPAGGAQRLFPRASTGA